MAARVLTKRRLRQLIVTLITVAAVATGVLALPDQPAVVPAGERADWWTVQKVNDGDTIQVSQGGRIETVRLIGVDTPETKDPRKPVQCFGQEAAAWTQAELMGRRVRLELDPSQGERDRYDRLLAYVWRDDGQMINALLITEGFAHEYTYMNKPYKYQLDFQTAEATARAGSRGLWNPSACGGDTTQPAQATPK